MVYSLLIFAALCCTMTYADNHQYKQRVDDLLETFNTDFNINTTAKDCLTAAQDKAGTFDKSIEYRSAVTIVNIFTQGDCLISGGREFYRHLNLQINDTTPPFKTFAGLLNEAIDILSEENGAAGIIVYRGQRDFFPDGGPYQPLRFTSTSTNFVFALSWATSGCFVRINNATGLYVHPYSANPSQDEVLLKSTARYDINMRYVCLPGMNIVLKSYEPTTFDPTLNVSYVTSTVEMTQKADSWDMTPDPNGYEAVVCANATDTASLVQGHVYGTTTFAAMASILWNIF